MSADDGHAVMKIYESSNEYGIFHYFASGTYHHGYYTRKNALVTFSHPVAAILGAHRLESNDRYTEYGVSVSDEVLKDCKNFYGPEWEVSHARQASQD